MREKDVSSFDVERAREISRSLCAFDTHKPGRIPSVPRTDGYVRFSPSSTFNVPAEKPVPVAVEGLKKETAQESIPLPQNIGSWEDLLAWVAERFASEAAFIVDNQGFVIANRGKIPSDGFEGLGAEVYMAFEQLEKLDPLAGRLLWLDLEYTRRRISALRARVPNREQMIFVAVNASVLHIAHRPAIESAILDCMAALD